MVFTADRRGIHQSVRSSQPLKKTIKALLSKAETYFFLIYLRHLDLTEAYAIYAVFPTLNVVLASTWLGKQISPRQLLAVAIFIYVFGERL